MPKFILTIALALGALQTSHAQYAGKMKLIIFLDKSPSMKDELVVFADLAESITEKLERRCSEFSIAVSELEYGDRVNPMGIIGYPAFVTEEHPSPAEELSGRILSHLPTETCSSVGTDTSCYPSQAEHVGIREYTYSSIVTTLQINKEQIFDEPISQLFTLILTDAAPVIEPYTVDAALHHISTFIPLDQFSATSISHTDWDNPQSMSCIADIPDNGPWYYSLDEYKSLDSFVNRAKGFSFNVCQSREEESKAKLEQQINDFIDDVILRGCRLYS